MKTKFFMAFCAMLLLSACSPLNETGVNPTTPAPQLHTHTPELVVDTPVASNTSDETPSINTETITPAVTTQPTTSSTPTSEASFDESPTPYSAETKAIIIDHTSIELFDRIPEQYITAARNLRLMFSDRSVGENINVALDCLASPSWQQSPVRCRRDYYDSNWNWKVYDSSDLSSGLVPPRILFEADTTKYNRDNWTFEFRMGEWPTLTQDFIQSLAPAYISSKDVLTYQFTYLNVTDNDDIDDPTTGFFADNPNKYDVYDLEAFIARYPNKVFFFWTTSLARNIGTQTSLSFNDQMRQYARENNKILFDVADIESYTDEGVPCYDNRDGVEYCNQVTGKCENHPDDHQNIPAICQDYTTETDGGHLGSVSGGGVRIAKAFWVLMARIAGWDGISP